MNVKMIIKLFFQVKNMRKLSDNYNFYLFFCVEQFDLQWEV